MTETNPKRETIRRLNDEFRRTFSGGRILMTEGTARLPESVQTNILQCIRAFDEFTEDNDPYGEHDFGSLGAAGNKVFWKIDYYDAAIEFGSEAPADPEQGRPDMEALLEEERSNALQQR